MRLIDADALLEELNNLEPRCANKFVKQGIDDGLHYYMPKILEEQPTIDAVPVVRCKDCKYGWTHIYQTSAPALHCIKAFGGKEVDPMDFCSSGERKEGEG